MSTNFGAMVRLIALYFSFLMIAAISWFSTAAGFQTLGLHVLISALLSLAVQTGIAATLLHLIPRRKNLWNWPFSFGIYILLTCISVFFAARFWFGITAGAEQYAIDAFDRDIQNVVADADQLQDRYLQLQERLMALSMYSKDMADKEDNTGGGSCPADIIPKKGKGRFWAKRQWQRHEFTEIGSEFKRVVINVNAIVGKIRKTASKVATTAQEWEQKRRSLKDSITTLEKFYDPARFQQQRTDLAMHSSAEFNGFLPASDSRFCWRNRCFGGKKNACRDSEIVSRINQVLSINLPEKPVYDLSTINPLDDFSILSELVNEVWIAVASDKESQLFSGRYRLPLLLAIFFDLLLLLFGLLLQIEMKKGGHKPIGENQLRDLYIQLDHIAVQYQAIFDFDNPKSLTKDRIGYAVDFIEYIIERISTVFNRNERCVVFPHLNASTPGRPELDALYRIIYIFGKFGLLAEPPSLRKNEYIDYKKMPLSDFLPQILTQVTGAVYNGPYELLFLHNKIFTLLHRHCDDGNSEFATPRPNGLLALIPEGLYRRVGLPDLGRDAVISVLFEQSAKKMAEYIVRHAKERPSPKTPEKIEGAVSSKEFLIQLYPEISKAHDALCIWLRDDDHGLNKHTHEEEPATISWKSRWAGLRIVVIDEAGWEILLKLTDTAPDT